MEIKQAKVGPIYIKNSWLPFEKFSKRVRPYGALCTFISTLERFIRKGTTKTKGKTGRLAKAGQFGAIIQHTMFLILK